MALPHCSSLAGTETTAGQALLLGLKWWTCSSGSVAVMLAGRGAWFPLDGAPSQPRPSPGLARFMAWRLGASPGQRAEDKEEVRPSLGIQERGNGQELLCVVLATKRGCCCPLPCGPGACWGEGMSAQ